MMIAMICCDHFGLVLSLCFANFGLTVKRVAKDPAQTASLLFGIMPIYEVGLDGLVTANV